MSDHVHVHGIGSRVQLGVLLFALAGILLAAFPYFEQLRNANEIPRLIQSMSLVERGEWAIDGPSRRGIPVGPDVARSPVDDRLYPNKPPGASVVGALAYVLARIGTEPPTLRELTWWARFLAGTVPVLVIAALAWGRLRSAYGERIAAAAPLLVIFGTPLFAYARLFYGHALAAGLLYGGVLAIERGLGDRRPIRVALGGLAAATAITVEYGAAFAGLPIAVALLWPVVAPGRPREQRTRAGLSALAGLLAALVPVALLMAYQRHVYGSALATGYHHAADPGFAELHGQGLLGLGMPRWHNAVTHLFALDTGLLIWSPLVLIGLLGLARLTRHGGEAGRIAALHLAIFAVILLFGLGLSFEGGWRIGPRYMVVALPMLILGVAEVLERFRDHPRPMVGAMVMGLVGLAASWSLLANTLAATMWPHLDPTNISEPFGAVLLPLVEHNFGPYGLATSFRGGLAVSLAAPVLLGLGFVAWTGGRVAPQVVLLPMLFGALLGFVVVVGVLPRAVIAHPKTEANLRYIEKVYEPRMYAGKRTDGRSRLLAPLGAPTRRPDPE